MADMGGSDGRTIFTAANFAERHFGGKAEYDRCRRRRRDHQVAGDGTIMVQPGDKVVDLKGDTLMPGWCSRTGMGPIAGSISPAARGVEKPPGYLMLVG